MKIFSSKPKDYLAIVFRIGTMQVPSLYSTVEVKSDFLVLNCPLTEREAIALDTLARLGVRIDYESPNLLEIFPGRSIEDIKRILSCGPSIQPKTENNLLIVRPRKKISNSTPKSPSNSEKTFTEKPFPFLPKSPINRLNYHQSFVCKDASGPITSIALDDSRDFYGLNCMIGACAQQDPTYNRPGEILKINFDEYSAKCLVLDGHFSPDRACRSTVSAISYDPTCNLFLSVGYDGRICWWNRTSSNLLWQKRLQSSPLINCISVSKKGGLAAMGSQDGCLSIFNYSTNTNREPTLCSVSLVKKSSKRWTNSVDGATWRTQNPNQVLSFVGYYDKVSAGTIYLKDLCSGTLSQNIYTGSTGISTFDIYSDMLAIGTGGVVDDAFGSGEFYLFDLKSFNIKTSIRTGQRDMDSVKFSPCGKFIAVSETSDNSVFVYDIRNTDSGPLLKLSHTLPTPIDSMMGLYWLNNGNLATGGMDGSIRLHNLGNPYEPFQSINVGHHINCISGSMDDSLLFVGTDFGTIHCLSLNPAIASQYLNKHQTHY